MTEKNLPDSQRIVITGLGVVSALGIGIDNFWTNLLAKKNCISRIEKFDINTYTCKIAGEIKNFDPSTFMDIKTAKRNDPCSCYAIAGSKLAVTDANLQTNELNPDRFGVIIGSGIGGMETIFNQAKVFFEKGHRYVSPFMITAAITNIAPSLVAIEFGARGPNFSTVTACTSSSHAIGEAYHMMKLGKADVMIAGGCEAALNPLSFAGFCSMKAMATKYNDTPEKASRPFDLHRDGFVMSEGSGIIVMETLEHAKKRNAKMYCEIIGYSLSCDAYHITTPDPDGKGLVKCFNDLFVETGVNPCDVDYMNAHGTSTAYNDKGETFAIKQSFKEQAKNLIISSTKSQTGHLLGAAGGVEAIICAKSIKHSKIVGTMNYETADPECDLNYLPNSVIDHKINIAISDNLGFGGQNAALMFVAI